VAGRGEAAKVALMACMRKRLTTLNAMLKPHIPWRPREVSIAQYLRSPLADKTVAPLVPRGGSWARLTAAVKRQ
jgi:hypothetical protein